MEKKTRVPTQKRSLEKYNKIIEAAFRLFDKSGYHKVTTADIAKEAGVATGSVYAYFQDKKEIYIKVIEKINEKFNYPTHDFWIENKNKRFTDSETVKNLFKIFIKMMIDYHDFSKTFHDEMDALALLDKDIGEFRKNEERKRIRKTREVFSILSMPFKSEEEEKIFVHYSLLLVEDVCHKILYDNYIKDTDLCINKCVSMLYTLFENSTDYKELSEL